MPFLTVAARKSGSRASALGLCVLCVLCVSFVDRRRFRVAIDAMWLFFFGKFAFSTPRLCVTETGRGRVESFAEPHFEQRGA